MREIIIAIDGPAGAGKGTLARHLAYIYNLAHLDTGLLYRAVALKMLQRKIMIDEKAAAREALSLAAEDLKHPSLRDEEVGNMASLVASFPEVRAALLSFQRQFAQNIPPEKQGVVVDGRDIGSVVLPEAPCKLFITASPSVRAERRLKELHQKGNSSIYEIILEDIKTRDARDRERPVSPLQPARDAFIIDTSDLGIKEVVDKACAFIDSKYPGAGKNSFIFE